MNRDSKNSFVLITLAVVFLGLALAFARHRTATPRAESIPLVDPSLVVPNTFRTSYLQLIRAKADLSDFDCSACHEKGKPPVIKYDTNHNIIIPKEHEDIVMKHGSHNRNNVCFNCHDEQNLVLLQTRDGHEVKLEDSPRLCGSCHGPTYRDWEAGAHGRTGGEWNPQSTNFTRQICVDCHNPHSPKIPGRKPLPPPHLLHPAPPEKEAAHTGSAGIPAGGLVSYGASGDTVTGSAGALAGVSDSISVGAGSAGILADESVPTNPLCQDPVTGSAGALAGGSDSISVGATGRAGILAGQSVPINPPCQDAVTGSAGALAGESVPPLFYQGDSL